MTALLDAKTNIDPCERVRDTDAAVLVSLAWHDAPIYADVMADTGLPRTTVRNALCRLRDEGLVAWVPGCKGTIRRRFVVLEPEHRRAGAEA